FAFAGLVPFVTGAIGLWVTPEAWREWVMEEFLNFAAVILAFMGAIHWGLAMRAEEGSEQAPMQLGLSVIPPLLGWFALSLPIAVAMPAFCRSFSTLGCAEIRSVQQRLAPAWYTPLRRPLSLVIMSSMIVAWGSTLLLSYSFNRATGMGLPLPAPLG